MVKISKSTTIDAPVDKVFNYLSNPKNMLEWHPNITKVRNIAGKGESLQWSWDYKMMGISLTGKAQIVASITCTELRVESTGEIESNWTFGFKPEGGGTRLDFEIDYTVPISVLDSVGESIAVRRNERMTEMALANIKERMEG